MQKSVYYFFMYFIVSLMCQSAFCQTVDFIEYTRYASPPLSAFYNVTNVTGDTHSERIAYNPAFTFEGKTVLELKTLSSASGQEVELAAAYIQYNDDNIILLGSSFTEKTLGTVTLPFAPPITFPRKIEPGTKLEGSVNASVKLGPIPVSLTIKVTYEFESLETVVLDIGTFENTLRLRTIRAVSLSGIPLVSQDRTEWHHPTASMIKFKDNDFGSVGELTALDPSLPPQTQIEHWSLY